VSGFQIDIQAVVVYNSETGMPILYKHIYFVRNNVIGTDENDYNITIIDPCSPNPCLNGGDCLIGFNDVFACYCPINFTGQICEISTTTTITPILTKTTTASIIPVLATTKNCSPRTTPRPTPCSPNPCKNGAMCTINVLQTQYTCFCPSKFMGKTCSNYSNTDSPLTSGIFLGRSLKVGNLVKSVEKRIIKSYRANLPYTLQ
jgi:hypothetical protein